MKKMFAVSLSLLLAMSVLTACGSGNVEEEKESISVEAKEEVKLYSIACDQAYAPFSIQNEDGSYSGIDVEILEAISEIEGFEYELKPMDFSGIIPALTSGTIDGSIAGMNITDARKESVDFSDGYYESGSSIVVNAADDTINSFEDLDGKIVACKEGTTGQLWSEDHSEEYGFTVATFPDSVSMMMAVANGQADFLIEDFPVIAYQITIGEQSDLRVAIEAIEEAPQNGFAVNKGENVELLKMFNSGLAKIREDGTYDAIINQYK